MVDLFYDSFSCYATAQLPQRYNTVWDGPFNNIPVTIEPTAGPRGAGALKIAGVDQKAFVAKSGLPSGPLGIGFRFKTDNVYNEENAIPFFSWRQNGTTQVDIVSAPGGYLWVTRNGTLLGVGDTTIFSNTWHYVELRTTFHASAGAIILQLDGVVILTLSSVNTSATGTAYADEFLLGNGRLEPGFGGYTRYWADLYLISNAALKGVRRIDARFPIADVASVGFAPSSGPDKYAMVDETTPDSDTTYIESTALNDYALFSFQPLPTLTAPTIDGVQVSIWGENTEVGNRSVAAQCRSNGTDAYSGNIALTSSQYKYGSGIFTVDPDTGLPWADAAAVNDAALGAKVTV